MRDSFIFNKFEFSKMQKEPLLNDLKDIQIICKLSKLFESVKKQTTKSTRCTQPHQACEPETPPTRSAYCAYALN